MDNVEIVRRGPAAAATSPGPARAVPGRPALRPGRTVRGRAARHDHAVSPLRSSAKRGATTSGCARWSRTPWRTRWRTTSASATTGCARSTPTSLGQTSYRDDETDDARWRSMPPRECLDSGDVPVGAVIVRDGEARSWRARGTRASVCRTPPRTPRCSRCERRQHPPVPGAWTAARSTSRWSRARCARARSCSRGSTAWSFGARDPKAGFAGSLGNLVQDERLNHRVELTVGRARGRDAASCCGRSSATVDSGSAIG